ncbi:hypothetical protein ABS768_11605 [Flavobacterium sp. ST-75]|uniref:Uncharacterized protein n=1 Tax=Flavobacterium rhizophilum TaxID=3163296 RepID=A0ABW8YDP1_9FLAO
MYYLILRKLSKKLKNNLIRQMDIHKHLSIKNYLESFCQTFEKDNAFFLFEKFGVKADKLSVTVFFNGFSNVIYFKRDIHIEDVDEVYELELRLDVKPFINHMVSCNYEIERDIMGDFFTKENGYIYFSDYIDNILSSTEIVGFLDLYPDSMVLILNANH